MAGRRGFVILGFPRSGTTLLSRLLDAHPQVSSPPETYLNRAAARFLSEQTLVEGPPVGVLSALAFLGFDAEAVMAPLRAMIFDVHARIAGDKPVWVGKTAADIFHLETLEPLLVGHVRFITLVRNPLDVIASNVERDRAMGAQTDELFAATRGQNAPYDALARVWLERQAALDAFAERHAADCHRLRYEDLLADPAGELRRLFAFLALDVDPDRLLADAIAREPRVGLGDFRANEQTALRPPDPDGWRRRLPPGATSRIVPMLAQAMQAHGYAVPRVPRTPTREAAIRRYAITQFGKATGLLGETKPH